VFERRRNLVVDLINAAPGLTCSIPGGAFYAFASCSALIGLTTAGGTTLRSDEDVAATLLDEAGVATVHGSAFGLGPYIRIAYALDDVALTGACRAIETFCSSLSGGGLVGHG
jgi:aspartate aminotransferase